MKCPRCGSTDCIVLPIKPLHPDENESLIGCNSCQHVWTADLNPVLNGGN